MRDKIISFDSETALIVVDVQNGFITDVTKNIPVAIENLIKSTDFKHKIFTKFINTPNSQFRKLLHWEKLGTTPETTIVSNLTAYPSLIIDKEGTYTPLDLHMREYIHSYKLTTFYIVGIDTDICVTKTAVDLFEHGFKPIVLTEYCMTCAGSEIQASSIRILKRFIGKDQVIENSEAYFASL